MAKPPHGTQTAASKTVTADASLPTPRTPVGVELASFRDGILLPFFLGGKIREKTDKLVVLVFVKDKLLLILFSAKLHAFQQPLYISNKQ